MSDNNTSQKALEVFGRSLTKLREERGWSVEDLASKAGLAVDVVHAYERAEASASLVDQSRLARAFGVPLSDLVGFNLA